MADIHAMPAPAYGLAVPHGGVAQPECSISGVDAGYAVFLAGKTPEAHCTGATIAAPMGEHLFPHQAHCAEFALRRGRAALFLDTGLGKSLIELEFAKHAATVTGRPSLILTPLAVAAQIVAEGKRFGYPVRQVADQNSVEPGINVTNYDRLGKLDATAFGAVVLDESSILKSFTGKTTRALIDAFADTPFRLCATATPAPNDYMELGQHAEFLGVMPSNEMLMRWFITDQTEMGRYRLKGHAQAAFWDWITSWARMAQNPADLGFDGAAWELPPLQVHRTRVAGRGVVKAPPGELFAGVVNATSMHELKRQTAERRAEAMAGLVAGTGSRRPWLLWADTDYEADALREAVPEAVEVRGGMSGDQKERRFARFVAGQDRILVTKPSIAGFGLNFQHCADMAFVGRSFSYETYYQAVRRCWRFGQQSAVDVHLILAEGEDQIARVIDRKAGDHDAMKAAMASAMRRCREAASTLKVPYQPKHKGSLPSWLTA